MNSILVPVIEGQLIFAPVGMPTWVTYGSEGGEISDPYFCFYVKPLK